MKFSIAFAVLSTLVASTSAFVPNAQPRSPSLTIRNMAVSTAGSDIKGYYTNIDDARLDGDLPGSMNFDPLGFSETQGGLFFQREAEIKVSNKEKCPDACYLVSLEIACRQLLKKDNISFFLL
jgi:hypothetical protein